MYKEGFLQSMNIYVIFLNQNYADARFLQMVSGDAKNSFKINTVLDFGVRGNYAIYLVFL